MLIVLGNAGREGECREGRGCQRDYGVQWLPLRAKLSFEVRGAKVSPALCERVKEGLV